MLDPQIRILEGMRRFSPWFIPLLVLTLWAGSAVATTIIPAADPGELALDSHAVFLARAGDSRVLQRSNYLATATELEVVSVIKGPVAPGEVIESIVPGGFKDGVGWVVSGVPQLETGEIYFFFADRTPRGRWQPRLMADSVLRREIADDGSAVLVPLDEATHLNRMKSDFESSATLVPGAVDEKRFTDAIDRSLAGEPGWNWAPLLKTFDSAGDFLKSAPGVCSFMKASDGQELRWRTFDTGGSVRVYADDTGELAGGVSGITEVGGAVSRWNDQSGNNTIRLSFGGGQPYTMDCVDPSGLNDPLPNEPDEGDNFVVFNDPCDEISDLSGGCSGTIGVGGPWVRSSHSFDNQTWWTISSLYVVVNNGAGCLGSLDYERMMAHELGHGLGFGHTDSDSNSLMYPMCCNDHNSTDILCAEYLYPVAGPTNTPTRTFTPSNTPTPRPPTATQTPTWTPGGPTATPTPTPTWTRTATAGGPTSTPTRTPTRTPTSAQPTPTTGPSLVTVPVVVHTEGVGGTSWRSDVVISNQNSSSQTVRLTYQTDAKAAFSKNRTLAGFGTLLLEDLVVDLFRAGDGRGPLDVEVVSGPKGAPVVVSRAYSESSHGNLGSGLPADVIPSTDVVSLPGLLHDNDFRSSVAVTAGDEAVWATFDLYRGGDGLVAGGVKRKIEAGEQNQWLISKIFPDLARQGVPMTVRVTLARPGIVYATLVDNDSTDSAVFLGKEPATNWIIPAVARVPGAGGTFWSSSVSLWNTTGTACWVDLEYLPEKTDNSRGGLFAPRFKLNPYESRKIADVLLEKFRIENGKGTLIVKTTRPISVTSRVFTGCETCPQGGTSGNGVRTAPAVALAAGTRVLPGVRVLDGFRSNIGVVTSNQSVSFTFDLRDEGGTLRATAFKTVLPRTLQQWGIGKLFGTNFVEPDPAGSVVVSADRPYLAYMTVIDGSSQDPVFVMPQ